MIFVGALLISIVVGILTGLFGVGGGFLITPALNIILGIPMPIAVGTGALQMLGVSTAGLYRLRKENRTDFKIALVLFGGNFAGVQLGVSTLDWLKQRGSWTINGAAVTIVEVILLLVFFVMLSFIAGWLWYDTSRKQAAPEGQMGLFAHIKIPPYTCFQSLENTPRLSVPVVSYFGLALGFITGLLGIGGGVILVPALIYLVGMRTQRASATSLAIVWLSSFLAVIGHASSGNSDLMLAVPLLIGGSIGLQIGVNLCLNLEGCRLRRYFAFVVLAAVLMVLSKLVAIFI